METGTLNPPSKDSNCSYGYLAQVDAKMAFTAIRADLYNRAWGVVRLRALLHDYPTRQATDAGFENG